MIVIPGIGPLTAIAFITAIDDPARFAKSSSVGPIWA
ncbi:transposase [Ensifer sp. 4252]